MRTLRDQRIAVLVELFLQRAILPFQLIGLFGALSVQHLSLDQTIGEVGTFLSEEKIERTRAEAGRNELFLNSPRVA